jgi:hypothetical protein
MIASFLAAYVALRLHYFIRFPTSLQLFLDQPFFSGLPVKLIIVFLMELGAPAGVKEYRGIYIS